MVKLPPLFDPLAKEDPAGYRQVLSNQLQRGIEVAIGDRRHDPMLGRRDYGLMPWESSAKKYGTPDIDIKTAPIAESVSYGAGRLAGTVASDNLRSWFWRYNHPLAIVSDLGRSIPQKAGNVGADKKALIVPSVLSGFALATALDWTSGNTDPTNFAQGGRPKGYEALLPTVEDKTKSQNLAIEIPLGYVTGRKGKLLPWEEFSKERPDISPQQYQQYKEYQGWGKPGLFGLEQADPLATATLGAGAGAAISALRGNRSPGGLGKAAAIGAVAGLAAPGAADLISRMGIVKGTWNNLEGQPEAQLLGYKVPATAAALTAGAGLGIYHLNKRAALNAQRNLDQQELALTQARSQKAVQRQQQVQAQRQQMTPYQQKIEAMSPEMQDAVRSRIAQYEHDDFFQSASPEMQSRMMADEARRVARQDDLQKYFGVAPVEISPEQQKLVDEAVRSFRQRKGSPPQ